MTLLKWIIELFYGKWVCVVAQPTLKNRLIVCHKHSVTGRVRGYVDFGPFRQNRFYRLEEQVVRQHIARFGS